jgi:hypothetical protein
MAAESEPRTSRWTRVRALVGEAWRDVVYAGRRKHELNQPWRSGSPTQPERGAQPLAWKKGWGGGVRLVGSILPPIEPRRSPADQ